MNEPASYDKEHLKSFRMITYYYVNVLKSNAARVWGYADPRVSRGGRGDFAGEIVRLLSTVYGRL